MAAEFIQPPGAGSSELSENTLSREEVAELIKGLERYGLIGPIRGGDPGLRELGSRETVLLEEVVDWVNGRLTPSGREWLGGEEEEIDLSPADYLNRLEEGIETLAEEKRGRLGEAQQAFPELIVTTQTEGDRRGVDLMTEGVGAEEVAPTDERKIDPELEEALAKGPSSIIMDQVSSALADIMTSGPTKTPWVAWLLNPRATLGVLRAMVRGAANQARQREAVREAATWWIEAAERDSKRDVMLAYARALEESLRPYMEIFCRQRGIRVPPEGSLERMHLLLMLNDEMAALQTQAGKIEEEVRKIIEKRVEIETETAGYQMEKDLLPARIESAQRANVLRERDLTERVRHRLAQIAGGFSGGFVGMFGGLCAGIVESTNTLVRKHPKVAVPLGVGIGSITAQLVFYSGPLTAEALRVIALRGALAGLGGALTTGIGVGLYDHFTEKKSDKSDKGKGKISSEAPSESGAKVSPSSGLWRDLKERILGSS